MFKPDEAVTLGTPCLAVKQNLGLLDSPKLIKEVFQLLMGVH